MTKLSEMPLETQKQVNQAKFRHYHPWSVVAKEDSISTVHTNPSSSRSNPNRIKHIPTQR